MHWAAAVFIFALPAAGAECLFYYEKKKTAWKSMSTAPSIYTPVGHRPDWYWEEILGRRGLADRRVDGYEDAWLGMLFGQAQNEITGCSVHGGRYWEVVLDLRKLYDVLIRSARSLFLRRAAAAFNIDETYTPDQLPHTLRQSVCAPAICDRRSVANTIFPYAFATEFMGQRPTQMLGNVSFEDIIEIEELLPWESFDVDFAIGGIDSCGTASLHLNLDQHPELSFASTSDADYYFTNALADRLLPLRTQVEKYNARVQFAKEEKRKRTGVEPHIVGICIPMFFSFGLARQKLAAISRFKLILVFCDPVGRLEKGFMHHYLCYDDIFVAQQRGFAPFHRTGNEDCFKSTSALLSERSGKLKSYWQGREVALHMPSLVHLFAGRMMVFHQEELRKLPRAIFNSVAKFVGTVAPFQDEVNFPRYNSIGGHRTDLCHNATRVRALKGRLESEYRTQEKLLKDAHSKGLHLRSTRCDEIDLVKATYCPRRVACE